MVPVMDQPIPFGEVLEAVAKLSLDEQQALLEIVAHRMVELTRKKIASEIQEARKEFAEGLCQPKTTPQIMDEIIS